MKQKYNWIVMYNCSKDGFVWWKHSSSRTRKLARELKRDIQEMFPAFDWKIEKEPV